MQEIFYTLARDSAQIWQGIFPRFDKGFCRFGKGKCSLPHGPPSESTAVEFELQMLMVFLFNIPVRLP